MMIMNKTKKPGGILYVVGKSSLPLEQMTRYKYLGNWVTEDARCDENIRTRVGMAKGAFYIYNGHWAFNHFTSRTTTQQVLQSTATSQISSAALVYIVL